ncbi:unnamed protein product [Mytilus coruscus]|uniref:Reverse transcriptase domain-containing protein n=1 Tax=Mytilus coruscus TaxID=42192 RepID=A0A6J8EQJ2_MYTCO|nr:unnamed protein product [Mytilus coruscus]
MFEGIGKYKGKPIQLHIDENVKPVAQRHRMIPFHLSDKVEKELIKLQEQDIIEKVEGTPTPWMWAIRNPPKKNPEEIRLSSEIFQEVICNVVSGIPGVKNISDDIIIYGKSQAEHDNALDATFKRLLENGLTLNLEKCEFNKDQVVFFGVTFSKEGISPNPKKKYATLCEPLRRLTRQDTNWNWCSEQETAFEKLKYELSSDTVMTYFNSKHDIDILVDASPDKTIQKTIEFVRTGQWFKIKNITDLEIDIKELQALRSISGELVTYGDTILLRDNRIVLPSELRVRAVNIAHEGHQGITKTKAFLRSKIWFPGHNYRVDNAIKECSACQAVTHTKRIKPLRMSESTENRVLILWSFT